MTNLTLTALDPYAKRLTALANKQGAGLSTAKVTTKTWDTVLDAALDKLEGQVAAPVPAPAPIPAPAPPTPTAPPAPVYSDAVKATVAAAGLQAVLAYGSARVAPPSLRPVTAITLPAGWALTHYENQEPTLFIGANAQVEDVDTSGFHMEVSQGVAAVFTRYKIANHASKVYTAQVNGGASLTLLDGEVDGYATDLDHGGVTNLHGEIGSKIIVRRSYLHDGGINYLKSSGETEIEDNYIRACGQYPGAESHIDGFQLFGPKNSFCRNLCDFSDWRGQPMLGPKGGWTGPVFPDPGTFDVPVQCLIRDNILLWGLADKSKIVWTIQTGSGRTARLIIDLINNVIEPGSSGMVSVQDFGGGVTLNDVGNRNALTGAITPAVRG